MKMKHGVLGVMAGGLALMLSCGTGILLAQGPPPPGYQAGPPQPWEMPPSAYQEISRRGYHDGIDGARKDFGNHRPPNVNNRDEYRNPPYSGSARHDYRQAFKRGYQTGVQHIYNGQRY